MISTLEDNLDPISKLKKDIPPGTRFFYTHPIYGSCSYMMLENTGKSTPGKKPVIIYVPAYPGFEYPEFLLPRITGYSFKDTHKLPHKKGDIDIIIFETFPSGGLPYRLPFTAVPVIEAAAERIPTFLVPQGQGSQFPFRKVLPIELGAIHLETAYADIRNQVIKDAQTAFLNNPDPEYVKDFMREKYRVKGHYNKGSRTLTLL